VNEMNEADDRKREGTGNQVNCTDRDRIFEDGSAAEWTALEAHAATCLACAEEVRSWRTLSVAGAEMRDHFDSPSLWPRIQKSLAEQAASMQPARTKQAWGWNWESLRLSFGLHWQAALAGALVLLLVASAGWILYGTGKHADTTATGEKIVRKGGDLLRTGALAEVERTESAYMHAIDKLAADAKPQLDKAETPLLANYREKIQVLDSAIDDLRAQAGQNPSNAHLRYQLLAMYQEKQRTLQEVLEIKR
jgi:hypothetical protein